MDKFDELIDSILYTDDSKAVSTIFYEIKEKSIYPWDRWGKVLCICNPLKREGPMCLGAREAVYATPLMYAAYYLRENSFWFLVGETNNVCRRSEGGNKYSVMHLLVLGIFSQNNNKDFKACLSMLENFIKLVQSGNVYVGGFEKYGDETSFHAVRTHKVFNTRDSNGDTPFELILKYLTTIPFCCNRSEKIKLVQLFLLYDPYCLRNLDHEGKTILDTQEYREIISLSIGGLMQDYSYIKIPPEKKYLVSCLDLLLQYVKSGRSDREIYDICHRGIISFTPKNVLPYFLYNVSDEIFEHTRKLIEIEHFLGYETSRAYRNSPDLGKGDNVEYLNYGLGPDMKFQPPN